MKSAKMLTILIVALGLMLYLPKVSEAEPMGTMFTYQGRLVDANDAADGLYDFEFKLFDDPCTGVQQGSTIDINNLDVIDGYFTVELDFGSSAFDGNARWLETGVRSGTSTGSFTTLSPRQEVTPTPYAFQSDRAKSALQLIHNFVVAAGESVTAGDVVGFVDGYVQKGAAVGTTISYGSEHMFNSGLTVYISAAALSDSKFVVAYKDSSDYGTAVIGDVSGNSITYGSEYVFNSANTYFCSVAALSSTKFVVAYTDWGNSGYGTACIGDVSGTTITYGSEYVFNSGSASWTSAVGALSSTQFVVAFTDWGNSEYGTACIGDVSGTTITYGPEYVFETSSTAYSYTSIAVLSPSKFVVAYEDDTNSSYGTAIIGDVAGTTITYGSEYVFNSATGTWDISPAALSSSKFVVAYVDYANSQYGTAVIGDVSGNVITYGSECVFNSAITDFESGASVAALSSTEFVVVYRDSGDSRYGTAIVGQVTGNTITYGSEYVFYASDSPRIYDNLVTVALSFAQFVVSYTTEDMMMMDSENGTAIIGEIAIATNLVGIAKESKTASETVPVIIGGISDVHSGLTPGAVYYSDAWGDLTTDETNYKIGLAVSSTEILLDK